MNVVVQVSAYILFSRITPRALPLGTYFEAVVLFIIKALSAVF